MLVSDLIQQKFLLIFSTSTHQILRWPVRFRVIDCYDRCRFQGMLLAASSSAHPDVFKLKKLSVHGKAYRLNLLDTAGQERFRTLSNSYYRGAHGVILVYDISSRDSFLSMEKWYDEAENNAMPGAIMYLVCKQVLKRRNTACLLSFIHDFVLVLQSPS